MVRQSKMYQVSKSRFHDICLQAKSKADVLRHLGVAINSGNYKTLTARIKKDEVDISHMDLRIGSEYTKHNDGYRYSFDEIFCEKPLGRTRNHSLIKRLVKSKVWRDDKCCDLCGISKTWNDLPLILQLDHINGKPTDNRIENLRLLCPNCHSQTQTWSGRNLKNKNKKDDRLYCVDCLNAISSKYSIYCVKCINANRKQIKWPKVDIIVVSVANYGWSKTGKSLGVSDNAVRKHLKGQGLDITKWRSW